MKTAHWHALLLAGAGVMHFKAPQVYDAIVPRSLPGNARTYTLVSGAAELAIAAGLALPLTRRLAARLPLQIPLIRGAWRVFRGE